MLYKTTLFSLRSMGDIGVNLHSDKELLGFWIEKTGGTINQFAIMYEDQMAIT